LLDEPFSALDRKLRETMQIELRRLLRELGTTAVFVTHDQDEALTMSDRIAVMNRGVIEQVADPETVYESPATTFVAGFIGVSNLMPGEVVSANGARAEMRLDAGPTVTTSTTGATVGERVHAVVRPEKLVLEAVGAASTANRAAVEGQVESSLYLGTATQMVLRLADDTRMTVLVPNADADARRDLPAAGDAARLTWSDENIHMVREAAGDQPAAP
jgi:ABC-type Fe3+/spermidine/putrescine transport system ATPase subunit